MVKVNYKVGDKVFAKVKGHPPWPAKILNDTGKKKFNVMFYGTKETGAIKPEDLSYYLKYKESYLQKYLKRRVGYEDAVKEIEAAIRKDGGDGNPDANGDSSVPEIDTSDTSSVSSLPDKKNPKRKAFSASFEDKALKRTYARRTVGAESRDTSEEPAPKRPTRKSSISSVKSNEDAPSKSKEPVEVLQASEKSIAEEVITEMVEVVEKTNRDEPNLPVKEKSDDKGSTPTKEEPAKQEQKAQTADTITVSSDEDLAAPEVAIEKPSETLSDEGTEIGDDIAVAKRVPSNDKQSQKKLPNNIDLVTEQTLKNNISYAEHVKANPDLYKNRPVEPRKVSKDQMLPVKLPSGKFCGVTLHDEWPLTHDNEYERAMYDYEVAKLTLNVKNLLVSGQKTTDQVDVAIVPDIQMTTEQINNSSYLNDIEAKREKLEMLKKEAVLVTWDSKIKNNLGLDKAFPEKALSALGEFRTFERDVETLMFKKHPHVLDTIRRLRKYVGNTKEWAMSVEESNTFARKAEKIRNEAEKIYNKVKNLFKIKEEKGNFWDRFMEEVADFRTKCKDLTENEILLLCSEPESRQAFVDKLENSADTDGSNTAKSKPLQSSSVAGKSDKN
ncbi:hepatoma-derived growth factor-related protein 2 isoform X1 [Dendroctonus ponderosae]|uniref:PWWP domain-containing protein n=1 Tax=Dendroctonus ponderosae TaxID=77166 RepID=U4U3C5_DENPD|nr:hepatoma-derived growth factor-related protein 2 isoform X1 [Dendroctonus ponderosae]ERL85111.1 hypothetical protein D910_02533 [Dendroctonus ponderosae]